MEITLKFQIGDHVFCLIDNKIKQCELMSITWNNLTTVYHLKCTENYHSFYKDITEDECHNTVDQLLEHLKDEFEQLK